MTFMRHRRSSVSRNQLPVNSRQTEARHSLTGRACGKEEARPAPDTNSPPTWPASLGVTLLLEVVQERLQFLPHNLARVPGRANSLRAAYLLEAGNKKAGPAFPVQPSLH